MFYRSDFVRLSTQKLPAKLCKQPASELTCLCVNCQAFCLHDTSHCRSPANLEVVMIATEMASLTIRLTADACHYCRTHQRNCIHRQSQCIEVGLRLCARLCVPGQPKLGLLEVGDQPSNSKPVRTFHLRPYGLFLEEGCEAVVEGIFARLHGQWSADAVSSTSNRSEPGF